MPTAASSSPSCGCRTSAEWMVLSSHGFELRRVTAPGNFLLFEADHDVMWGVNFLPDETMEVARLRVKRG